MEVESVAVDIIGNTLEILLECEKKGEVQSKQVLPSIYMVPSEVRDLSPSSFTPRVVAIGPLHRQDPRLKGFEVQKTAYLHNLLHNLGLLPEQTLRGCVEKVIGSIERIKACYGGSTTYEDIELAKMMVIDACFILGFIWYLQEHESSRKNKLVTNSIIDDMLLIENQIPFFVLEIIFDSTVLLSGRMKDGASLNMHIKFLVTYHYFIEGDMVPDSSDPDHILGFLYKYLRPREPMPPVSRLGRKRHTAMELDRAGIKFKPNNEVQNWALAMKMELPLPLFPWSRKFMTIPPFSWFQRPTLRMPTVNIHDSSELIFRNLVVYEQTSDVQKYVTAYLWAMDMLIDTSEDVALLIKSKVLISQFGSNEEAADMINKLCKFIDMPDFFYDQEWEEMDAFYNSYWPNTIAGLKRTYFNNPWSILALFAAFVLFGLTITGTIFTILAA